MTLIVFDIDGTLTATSDCDMKCYASAFEKVFGFPLPSLDWHDYKHVTDSGVMGEVLEGKRGSFVTQEELETFEQVFMEDLEREYNSHPETFGEIPGAGEVLQAIAECDDMAAALATGGMRATALFKLSKAGMDGTKLPAGFANDSFYREGIAKRAIELAEAEGIDCDDIVYVGDGIWDARTSANLGMRFIGISMESSSERLLSAGAQVILEDYSDIDAFFDAVATATVPEIHDRV